MGSHSSRLDDHQTHNWATSNFVKKQVSTLSFTTVSPIAFHYCARGQYRLTVVVFPLWFLAHALNRNFLCPSQRSYGTIWILNGSFRSSGMKSTTKAVLGLMPRGLGMSPRGDLVTWTISLWRSQWRQRSRRLWRMWARALGGRPWCRTLLWIRRF